MAAQIISPTPGTVKGTVAVIVSGATTNRVVVRVDGVVKARPTRGTDGKYRWSWLTPNYPDGAHLLSVDGGNTLAMTVDNVAAPAPTDPLEIVAQGNFKWVENVIVQADGVIPRIVVPQRGGASAQGHVGICYDGGNSRRIAYTPVVTVAAGAPKANVGYVFPSPVPVRTGQNVGCGVLSELVTSPGYFYRKAA